MKQVYPALLVPEGTGWRAILADLPGCRAFGDDLAGALELAAEAASLWLLEAQERGEQAPEPGQARPETPEGGFVSLVVADPDEARARREAEAIREEAIRELIVAATRRVRADPRFSAHLLSDPVGTLEALTGRKLPHEETSRLGDAVKDAFLARMPGLLRKLF